MIRVLLVDDHVMMREGTVLLLRAAPEIEIVAETGEGQKALELARCLRPDVVLLDIRLPDISGVEVARTLRQELPEIKVVIVSAYDAEQYVRALFAIGVHGYLLKSTSGSELIAGIQAVCRGETVLCKDVAARMADKTRRRSGIAANETLSDREREILTLVGQGAGNKEIATQLNLGVRTVETHVSNAMAKLRARSRTEAINIAVQRGFIVLES
jgi:DNA-binding NarL/FixJ family response regulator